MHPLHPVAWARLSLSIKPAPTLTPVTFIPLLWLPPLAWSSIRSLPQAWKPTLGEIPSLWYHHTERLPDWHEWGLGAHRHHDCHHRKREEYATTTIHHLPWPCYRLWICQPPVYLWHAGPCSTTGFCRWIHPGPVLLATGCRINPWLHSASIDLKRTPLPPNASHTAFPGSPVLLIYALD